MRQLLLAALVSFTLCGPVIGAELCSGGFARDVSDSIYAFVVASEVAIFLDGDSGREAAEQGFKALVVADAAASLLKATVRERRPNRDSLNSFPSRHSAAAFAMAKVVSDYDSTWAAPAYTAAALIGWSRVETHEHHWWDVVAGAAIGYYVAKEFTDDASRTSEPGLSVSFAW